MTSVLIVIHTIISVLLIAVILMQAGQGGGLAGGLSAGMGNSIFGGRAAATALSRITTWFAIAFMANVLVFCTGIALSDFHLLVLPAISMPLCLWGVELYSD